MGATVCQWGCGWVGSCRVSVAVSAGASRRRLQEHIKGEGDAQDWLHTPSSSPRQSGLVHRLVVCSGARRQPPIAALSVPVISGCLLFVRANTNTACRGRRVASQARPYFFTECFFLLKMSCLRTLGAAGRAAAFGGRGGNGGW